MGACDFQQLAKGKNAQEAFNSAHEDACYQHGHAGYSGTLAEKHDFIVLTPTPEKLAEIKAGGNKMAYDGECPLWQKVADKWGPAGCIALGDEQYLFFGWASS